MLAGGHEDNVQQEQRVRRVWLHEMQLHRQSIENGVIEARILITKNVRGRVHGQCKYVYVSHIHRDNKIKLSSASQKNGTSQGCYDH